MKDLFGKAMLDYQTKNAPENILTETTISEEDEMSVNYLFRSFQEMPLLEQVALQMTTGKVLDIGCGAGSHSLYLQNEKKLNVQAIDISENAIKTCLLRGVQNATVQNILDTSSDGNQYDTILLLMNGTGIFGTLAETPKYLKHVKTLLSPKGQILIDSSDLIYMFDNDEDGGKWIPSDGYYGELKFSIKYKNEKEEDFPWLYLDYNTLQNAAHDVGLQCELIKEGDHYDYLARLSL
ncbi:MAG: class I SAM-dependent methyltransferase [Flavobacterium sp.]